MQSLVAHMQFHTVLTSPLAAARHAACVLLAQVASTIEESVAASAPAVGQKLQEAGQLFTQAGQEAAEQLEVRFTLWLLNNSGCYINLR